MLALPFLHIVGGILQSLSGNSQITVSPTATCPSYMVDALSSGHVSYSLHTAVEVAKVNAFRMSCVWQMVTSHLRIMTTHKVSDRLRTYHRICEVIDLIVLPTQVLQTRRVAVLATHDMILTALTYLRSPKVEISGRVVFAESTEGDGDEGSGTTASAKSFLWLTDNILFDRIMPSFESVFAGREYQR